MYDAHIHTDILQTSTHSQRRQTCVCVCVVRWKQVITTIRKWQIMIPKWSSQSHSSYVAILCVSGRSVCVYGMLFGSVCTHMNVDITKEFDFYFGHHCIYVFVATDLLLYARVLYMYLCVIASLWSAFCRVLVHLYMCVPVYECVCVYKCWLVCSFSL